MLATHQGVFDWFVPVEVRGRLRGVLATGPFAKAPPTSSELLERWRSLTGRQGHLADPEFSYYVSINLSTLVLDEADVASFGRLLVCLAGVMAGDDRAEELLREAAPLRAKLELSRLVDRIWDAARTMVDQRTARVWSSRHRAEDAARLGLLRPADDALVGLLVVKQPKVDPIEDVLRSDRFQRACVELARKHGDAIAGRLGDHGVVFLAAVSGSASRRLRVLRDLADRAAALAKRFGFELHLGASALPPSASLSEHYQAALRAAEKALSKEVRFVKDAPQAERGPSPLGELRNELTKLAEQSPKALPPRFERYLEIAAQHCGYRLEPVRVHLEVGFESILGGLLPGGVIEQRNLADLRSSLDRAATEARTVSELFAAYRRAIADVSEAVLHPIVAHRDRSLRRAVAHIHEHYTENLSLARVARVGGFAPNYFSLLFKEREQMTFAHYLRQLRTERAHQLLSTTDLALHRVAQLSGFGTANYMARVFRETSGTSPRAMRKQLR